MKSFGTLTFLQADNVIEDDAQQKCGGLSLLSNYLKQVLGITPKINFGKFNHWN